MYYHPTLNPTGMPPPGKPQRYRTSEAEPAAAGTAAHLQQAALPVDNPGRPWAKPSANTIIGLLLCCTHPSACPDCSAAGAAAETAAASEGPSAAMGQAAARRRFRAGAAAAAARRASRGAVAATFPARCSKETCTYPPCT